MESLDDSIVLLKRYFGEILMSTSFEIEEDSWSGFFATFVNFATMHKAAMKELVDFDKKKKQQDARIAAMSDRVRGRALSRKIQPVITTDISTVHKDGDNIRPISVSRRPISSPRSPSRRFDVCEIFKERMIALHGDDSDSEDEW